MTPQKREPNGSSLKNLWRRFWARADRNRDAKHIKAQIRDNQRRHMPVRHLQMALVELRHAQLRAEL